MSVLMRQELGAAVHDLAKIVTHLHQKTEKLSEFSTMRPEEIPTSEEEELRRCIKVEQHRLRRHIDNVKTILREYRDFIQQLPTATERSNEEQLLASLPTFSDEFETEADKASGQWPIFRLISKAGHVLDRIEAYLAESSDGASDRGGDQRVSTPDKERQEKQKDGEGVNINRQNNSGEWAEDELFNQHMYHQLGNSQQISANAKTLSRSNGDQRSGDPFKGATAPPFPKQKQDNTAWMSDNLFRQFDSLGGATAFSAPKRTNNNSASHHVDFRQSFDYARANVPPSNVPLQHEEDALRVNRIEIPRFGGAPEEWVTFWAAFNFAVHSRNYPNFQKQLLLLQYLEKGSPARRMIEGYPPSDDNYTTVVNILRQKFGNERFRRDQLHAQLLRLKPANNNLKDLRQLQQEIERICTQLDNMDPDRNVRLNPNSSLIADIIKGKLPHATLLELIKLEREAVVPWIDDDWRKGLAAIVDVKEQADLCVRTFQSDQPSREAPNPAHHRSSMPQRRQSPPRFRPSRQSPPRQRRDYPNVENTRAFTTIEQPAPTSQIGNTRRGAFHCSLCSKDGHKPSHCLTYPTMQLRKKRLEEQGRCLRCLRQSHLTKDCTDTRLCHKCESKDHHWLLCPANDKPAQSGGVRRQFSSGANATPLVKVNPSNTHSLATIEEEKPFEAEEANEKTTLAAPSKQLPSNVDIQRRTKPPAHLMTQTLAVSCHGGPKEGIPGFSLYDPCSQTGYITRRFVNRLNPQQTGEQLLHIHTFGSKTPKVVKSATVTVRLKRLDGFWEPIELNVIDEITTELRVLQWDLEEPTSTFDSTDLHLVSGSPDILIGIRQFWDFFVGQSTIRPGLHRIDTIFGPMIGGEADFPKCPNDKSLTMVTLNDSNVDAMPKAKEVDGFLSLETIGIRDDPEQEDDNIAMQLFDKSVRQLPSGRYSVRLPWREQHPPLPSNWAIAYRRLLSTVRRLQFSPKLLDKYSAELQRQADADIIEDTGRDEDEHFLPHHAVINPKKLRIVIDASAHATGTPSLNDCLYRGPVLLPELCGILTRFRLSTVPVLADVQAAFHAIEMEPENRRFCKILWLKDPHQPVSSDNLRILRYKKVVFGATCSPFILAAVLLHHFDKTEHPLAKQMADNTYVDNLLLECESVETAIDQSIVAKDIFRSAEMNLREFLSHRPEVMSKIPEEDRLDKPNAKVLGLIWDTSRDQIVFKFPEGGSAPHTRRSVLSTLSSVFDPLGLIGPCLLPAKLFFQRLWEDGHSWDFPLPPGEQADWDAVLAKWNNQEVRVKRHAIVENAKDLQLHVFCDASEHTFATTVYIRSESEEGVQTYLLFSKNRLRPRKANQRFTIPRMELLAILIGIRAKEFILNELKRQVSSCHVWSDSQIALSWIKSEQPKQQFEQKRIVEIRQKGNAIFHFVRTDQNPADIASRGQIPEQLNNIELWWEGPQWLVKPPDKWPDEMSFEVPLANDHSHLASTDEEPIESGTFMVKEEPIDNTLDPFRFVSMLTLIGAVIYVLRFLGKWRPNLLKIGKSTISSKGKPTGHDYRLARIFLIKRDQQKHLGGYDKHPTIVNEDDLICLKTRLIKVAGPPTLSAPILLDRRSPLTKLIIQEIHQDLLHAGLDWTLTEFLGRYWIPQARRTIKGILHHCSSCRKITAPPFARPEMPPLPATRVKPANPFEFVGLDFAGPTPARHGENIFTKTYIVIITCFVTRAVYLEPTRDLSAPTFINVLRRFFSRRGRPRRILSDNAPTFVQTHKALEILTGPPYGTTPQKYAAQKGIQWDFIPAYSPWMGAIYERLIGLVKGCIMKTIGRRILDYDDLSAFLAEIEASINNRPIVWVSDQPDCAKPLTPKDLIQQSGPNDIEAVDVDLDYDDDKLSGPERLAALWKAYREASDHFWLRWSQEYILAIRERAAWKHKGPRSQTRQIPRVGQVVLIEEDLRPRNLWPIGIIASLNGHPPDIRSVQVKMTNGKLVTRPISRLCPLETELENIPDHQQLPQAEIPDETTKATIDSKIVENDQEFTEPGCSARPIPPSQPQPAGHSMITRRKGRILGVTPTLVILALSTIFAPNLFVNAFWPLADPHTNPCEGSYLNCSARGVKIHASVLVQKITICCMQFCFDRPAIDNFVYELSSDILVNDYTCSAWYWIAPEQMCTAQITCPAIDECSLIDCYFCLEQLANWPCNPTLSAIIVSGLLFIIGATAGWILCCCNFGRISLTFFYRGVALLLSWPIRAAFYIAGRKWTQEDRENVVDRVEKGARRAKQSAIDKMRQARQRGLRAQRAAARMIGILICIPTLIIFVNAETISVSTSSETCTRDLSGLTCRIDSATTLTLFPVAKPVHFFFETRKDKFSAIYTYD